MTFLQINKTAGKERIVIKDSNVKTRYPFAGVDTDRPVDTAFLETENISVDALLARIDELLEIKRPLLKDTAKIPPSSDEQAAQAIFETSQEQKNNADDILLSLKSNNTMESDEAEQSFVPVAPAILTELPFSEKSTHSTVKKGQKYARPLWLSALSNMIYFLFVITILLVVLNFSAKSGIKSLFDFHLSCALTEEALPNIRPGSLIISKVIPVQDFRQGDVITYIDPNEKNAVATISSIAVNYEKTGRPAFRTQDGKGKTNPDIVKSEKVTGKMTFCLPVLGAVMDRMGNNLWILALTFVVLFTASVFLDRKFRYKIKPKENTEEPESTPEPAKKMKKVKAVSNLLFYVSIIVALFAAVAYGGNGSVKNFFGYSYMGVLTPSMQSEIPQGSVVIVKHTSPDKIHTDDNITYLKEDGTTVTHKVIQIFENYENSGAKGFQTKGVDNNVPDKDIVLAANVVGVVKAHIPYIGALLMNIAVNVWVIIILFALSMGLSVTLRIYITESRKEKRNCPKLKRPAYAVKHSKKTIKNRDVLNSEKEVFNRTAAVYPEQ